MDEQNMRRMYIIQDTYNNMKEARNIHTHRTYNCSKISPFVLEYHYTQHVNIKAAQKKMLRLS